MQYWDSAASATTPDAVYDALIAAATAGVHILEQSDASDQDAYVVSKAFADENGVISIADLATVPVPHTLDGNSEARTAPSAPTDSPATTASKSRSRPSRTAEIPGQIVVASEGFEPPKLKTSDLQSDPFGRLGNLPGRFRPHVVI